MAAVDIGKKRKLKEAPPVPLKTYQWEDVRRNKKRGKYPYTYLYKNLLEDLYYMEDDKKPLVSAEDEKPVESEQKKTVQDEKKKKKVVRKLKKTPKVDELTLKDKVKEVEKAKEEVEVSSKMDVEEVLPKADVDSSRVSEQSKEKKSDEVKIEEMPASQADKPEENIHAAEEETEHLTITTETRDLSAERQTNEDKEEETISAENEIITKRQDSTDDMEIKYEPLVEDESLDKTDRMSMDLSPDVISKADSKNTESEDTYTESNIEQYLDKEEISKSVSDASGLEGATSVSDVEFAHDNKPDVTPSVSGTPSTLEIPQDHKRKHSGTSEMTKSDLSLFEKMKNTKFKPPTFKIPKFKKLTFNKKGFKRVKHDPKEQISTTVIAKSEVTLQRRISESPVYIYIPLNPSAEELEKERQEAMKSESHRRLADTSDSSTDRLNDSKDTNGTLSSTITTTSRNVDSKPATSKWKGLQSKTDKKSPPFKKKSKITNGKKSSPKSEKKTTTTEKKTSPATKKRGDSPVEYIYIPLKPPENETWNKPSSETEKSFDEVDQVEAVNTKLISEQTERSLVTKYDKDVVEEEENEITEVRQVSETKETQKPEIEIKQLPKVISKPDEDKSKGAIKKKTDDKGKNIKNKTTKLTKDIKKLASKLKGVHKKTKRGGSKKASLKAAPKTASVEKKTSPTSEKRGDSPVEYIYIPLKGPLADENSEDKPIVVEQVEEKSSETRKEDTITEVEIENDSTKATDVEPTVKVEELPKTEEVTMAIIEKEPSPLPVTEVPINKTVSKPTPIKSAPVSAKTKSQPVELKQVEDTKKLSLMSKLKGLKPKTEKKSPPAIKKGIKQFTAKKVSPKSRKKETVSKKSSPPPSVKRSDSPVEYIYIPLKPLDSGISEELPKRTDDKADETPMAIEATKEKTPAVERLEINDTPTHTPEVTANDDASVVEQKTAKGSVMLKLKDTKSKPEEKSPPTKKKTGMESPKMEKTSASSKRDSPPVEYIYIPLTPKENEEDLKQRSVTPIRETITPISEQIVTTAKLSEVDSKLEIQQKPKEAVIKQVGSKVTESKSEKIVDKPKETQKENIMTKLKGLKPKKAQAPKADIKAIKELVIERKSPSKALQSSDAPVEYIYIPLKSQTPQETESKTEETMNSEESELCETKSMVEQVETENVVKESMTENIVESATVSEVVPQNSCAPSEESKRQQTSVKSTEPAISSVSAEIKLPPSSAPSTEEDNTKKARLVKESVIKKWQGFKTKPLQKPMPLKRKEPKMTSPKTEKKSAASKSKEQPPVVVRRGDSPVDYIYIPLNPTEEQLEFEREIEEQKRLAAPKKSSAARTPERSPEPTKKSAAEEDKSKKSAVKTGAIKKQPTEKGNKIKDTTTKLTEDIKKFALKLKNMQKKSKKPTFKTFKRGSKSGSNKMSPTTSKKPVDSRSPPMPKQRGDSPVEYIFIPLKPSPEEEQFEREFKEKQVAEEKKAALSLPQHSTGEASVTEKIEESPEILRKPVVVETIQKTGKKEPVKDTSEPETVSTSSSSPFNSLKKTKEFGKNKLKALKDAVQPAKEKKIETKVEKTVVEEKTVVTTKEKRDSPEYIFIPLKGPETAENPVKETERDEASIIIPSKIVEPTKKPTPEEPHYEPLTKEDEEDGLKTAIIASLKEVKPSDEEPAPLKSVLKAEDSPKLNKKVSFESIRMEETENGLDNSQSGDENAIYETIQIKGEQPGIGVSATRTPVTVSSMAVGEQIIKDTSLEDDHNKWSKSTDHEYEPVNPPPEIDATPVSTSSPLEAPRPVHVTDTDLEPLRHKKIEVIDTGASAASQQQSLTDARLLRIPLDKELVVPNTNAEETISFDKSLTSTLDRTGTPDSRSRLLERAIGTPDTSSRTDGISTSQVDSSALEHLPLKKESRQKSKMAQSEDQGPNIQEKIRNQAGRLKTKIKGMKKPTFTIPNPKFSPKFRRPKFQKPKLQRPKFETPKFTMPTMPKMPKMPDRPKMNMPSFSLPRPGNLRRQQSADKHISTTESSADSKKNNIFDFRTYPRFFDRTKKNKASTNATISSELETPAPEFATVPRAAARKKGPVGSRWVHRFTDIEYADEESTDPRQMYNVELQSKDRGDSLERRMEADLRYEEALAEDDDDMREYERENQDINRHSPYIADRAEYSDRWRHGSFRKQHHDEIDEFDHEMRNGVDHDERHTEDEMHQNIHDEHSSVASSGSRRHRGVIEEIDSDQFFLREKGISQDNIQVGLYLSSEIRDAFRQPMNALSQMQGVQPGYGSQDYDLDASDLSLTRPSRPKRKHFKKTKRVKKTPHASQEQIQYDQESVNTETEEWSRDYNDYKTFPPARPKRNRKQQKNVPDDVHEVDMPVDDEVNLNLENLKSQEDLPGEVDNECMPNILGYEEKDMDINEEYNKYLHDEALMYENEIMKGIQQPEIVISADQKCEIAQRDVDRYLENTGMMSMPKPPTRRHKSLKSLNLSEHDSIMGEFNKDRVMQDILEQELNVYRIEHEYMIPVDEPPVVPIRRTRSRSRTESQAEDDRTSHGAESLISECHEPPCLPDIRDSMGYAVIDKSKQRDPPLPSAPRRRRSTKSNKSTRSSDTKFFTVPRPLNDTPPARPQRNYSTLGPNRPPRRKSELDLSQAEEKENIDITQYIEIEDDDHSRDLQSGEIINKMKGRPLPAPPRPPRKTRDKSKEALHDITQETNIMTDSYIGEQDDKLTTDISPASPMEAVEEIEVSTQTDPLPDDFCCEEVIEEPTDRIVAPTRRKRSIHRDSSTPRNIERPKTPLERSVSPNAMIIERRVQTPTEDVTHASLLVRPVPEYSPDSYVSKRFAADIPDIFSAPVIPQPRADVEEPVIEEDIIKETKPEPERKVLTPIYSEISKLPKKQIVQDDVDEPSVIPTELLDIFSQPPIASVETDETLSYTQTETFTLEHEDEVPEMPEKPQRRKSQAQVQSTIKSEVPPPPVSPPMSPQPQIIERIIERQVPICITPGPDTEVEILKAHRLQVTDLDVERLNVTELQAQKILVSEIDGVTLQISELTSKSGNLVVNGLEISSGLLQELLERLQPAATQSSVGESSPSVEQVSTQTNIEDTLENTETNKLAEPANVEQIGTQTSIELPDEADPPPVMEPVSTQTSLDEPDVVPSTSVEQVATQTSIEEPDDCNVPDLILASPERDITTASPTEKTAQSPTIQIVEPVRFVEGEETEEQGDFTPAQLMELQSEIDDIIDTACEHVNRDTAYINEMLLDSLRYEVPDQFSPTMSDEIIIDLPGHVIIETEDPYTGETIFFQQPLDERLPMEFREMIEREMELEREEAAKQQSVLMSSSPQLMDIPEEEELKEEKTKQITESPLDQPTEDSEISKEFIELNDKEELLMDVVDKPREAEIKEESVEQSEDNVVPSELKDEEETLIELLTMKPDVTGIKEQRLHYYNTSSKSDAQEAKAEHFAQQPKHSIVPKEFRELKDEQEAIIVQLQKEIEKTQELLKKEINIEVKEMPKTKIEDTEQLPAVEVIVKEIRSVPLESSPTRGFPPAIPPLPKEHLPREIVQEVSKRQQVIATPQRPTQQEATKSQDVKENSKQTESFSAQSNIPPSRPPLPQQDNVPESHPQVQMIQGVPYPVSYYPEYVHSIAPQSFYTLRSHQPRDLSEDDIPVHHRRRRHHRHMSRSSSDEDRRTVSRRTRASSADPSIPQLTGQLAKACSISAGRVLRQMTNYLSSSNVLSKQQLQIVMVILLILIAGLILMGLSDGKTVHLHHWEYFNPPKEL